MLNNNNYSQLATKRRELTQMLIKYQRIRDCLAGSDAVKSRRTTYLPMPNLEADNSLNLARYESYLLRAAYYNATKSTLKGLHGQIFMREPILELPEAMNYLKTDTDGQGLGLVQLVKRASLENLALGRGGFFVDYPFTGGGASAQAIADGRARPYIYFFAAEQIINWKTSIIDGVRKLTTLILEDTYDVETSTALFSVEQGKMWRVLTLQGNIYRVQTVFGSITGKVDYQIGEVITPTDADGDSFDSIPFFFVGSENNDSDIDAPPLDDIATMNIAHYRNSADYEDSCFFAGQPTLVITGLTQQWLETHMHNGVMLGSRASLMLPQDSDAKFLQVSPNIMPLDAMRHKEKQMVALGAKLVEQPNVVRTASEAQIDSNNENSTLSSVALNVSSAATAALKFASRFAGEASDNIRLELNTDFDIANMSPEKLRQLVETWQKGGVTFSEMRTSLVKAGLASIADPEAEITIQQELSRRAAEIPDTTLTLNN